MSAKVAGCGLVESQGRAGLMNVPLRIIPPEGWLRSNPMSYFWIFWLCLHLNLPWVVYLILLLEPCITIDWTMMSS